jgi:hypothetical protein
MVVVFSAQFSFPCSFWKFSVEGFDDFECYPNRDSKPYRELYGIPECATVIRGTLRNQGWCEKIKKLVDLGYVEEMPLDEGLSYGALTAKLIGKSPASKELPAQVAGERREREDRCCSCRLF